MLNAIFNIIKGAVLGLAMIIPGVSGGTMAVIFGIYERLIRALHGFSPSTLKEAAGLPWGRERKTRLGGLWNEHDLGFLAQLFGGALLSILACSHLIEYLIKDHPNPTNGFFFGLVGASIIFPLRLMERKSMVELACGVAAMALTIGISIYAAGLAQEHAPQEAAMPHSLFNCARLAICGCVASSAMLLPGISGSFLLLLLGVYHEVLGIINQRDYLLLVVFAASCAIGLVLFARLINLLLSRYRSSTMAFLAGLMAGSLWNLWPFRETGARGPAWPAEGDSTAGVTILTFLAGAAIVGGLAFYGRRAKPNGGEKQTAEV